MSELRTGERERGAGDSSGAVIGFGYHCRLSAEPLARESRRSMSAMVTPVTGSLSKGFSSASGSSTKRRSRYRGCGIFKVPRLHHRVAVQQNIDIDRARAVRSPRACGPARAPRGGCAAAIAAETARFRIPPPGSETRAVRAAPWARFHTGSTRALQTQIAAPCKLSSAAAGYRSRSPTFEPSPR